MYEINSFDLLAGLDGFKQSPSHLGFSGDEAIVARCPKDYRGLTRP